MLGFFQFRFANRNALCEDIFMSNKTPNSFISFTSFFFSQSKKFLMTADDYFTLLSRDGVKYNIYMGIEVNSFGLFGLLLKNFK